MKKIFALLMATIIVFVFIGCTKDGGEVKPTPTLATDLSTPTLEPTPKATNTPSPTIEPPP